MAYDDTQNNEFVDTTIQPDDSTNYEDGSHIPNQNEISNEIGTGTQSANAKKIAEWIRQKRYGVDVREALALWVEWIDTKFNALTAQFNDLKDRQTVVESRQTTVENDFQKVISNATVDSEVILARNNESLKYNATSLDGLLEYMGGLIAKYVPNGFKVTITHTLNRNITATAKVYENAFDTEIQGFGSVNGAFGGSTPASIPVDYYNVDNKTATITLPVSYGSTAKPQASKYKNNIFYIINGNQTIEITLS